MKSAHPFLAGIATLAGALIFASAVSRAQSADGIVVYNAQHASLTQAWADGFTKETGIKITLRNGGDTELGNQIVQEGVASPADVFLTENSPAMVLVDAAACSLRWRRIPWPRCLRRSGQLTAGGSALPHGARCLPTNKTKLTEGQLPKSLLDLADPGWKGRWAASPTGADFQAIVSALLEIKGEAATAAWLKAMKENVKPYRGNGTAMKAVNAGEVDGAVIYHYYYFGDQAKTG